MKKIIALSASLVLLSLQVFSQSKQKSIQHLNLEDGIAIQGYDPLTYFQEVTPTKGLASITTVHQGVTYQFTSEKNKALFLQEPETYIPQYGGWCAYAMGLKGQKVGINPETYKIVDGKLYLFYNAYFTNTLKPWNKNEKSLKENADIEWQKILEDNL